MADLRARVSDQPSAIPNGLRISNVTALPRVAGVVTDLSTPKVKAPNVRPEPASARARTSTRLVLTLSDGREVRVEDRARRHGRFMNVDAESATHRVFATTDGKEYRVKLASPDQASIDATWLAKQFATAEQEDSAA